MNFKISKHKTNKPGLKIYKRKSDYDRICKRAKTENLVTLTDLVKQVRKEKSTSNVNIERIVCKFEEILADDVALMSIIDLGKLSSLIVSKLDQDSDHLLERFCGKSFRFTINNYLN